MVPPSSESLPSAAPSTVHHFVATPYLRRTTGLSRSQVTKLVGRSQREQQLRDRRRPGRPFASKYTRADSAALAELDGEHGRLSGPATRKLCQRAWEVYGDGRYERLAGISNGHVYNLRKTVAYRRLSSDN